MVSEGRQYGGDSQDYDDAEKGISEKYSSLSLATVPPRAHIDQRTQIYFDDLWSPLSPIHEGITPSSSVPVLSLSWPAGWKPTESAAKKPARPKQKISRWIIFQVWFTTYRKFFVFVTLLNLAGIVMASLGRFQYLGALVLGNLLCAILMRNELFLRFLYIIAIYGLRSARPFLYYSHDGR
jgi:hypothetical protein